jgi:protein-S-isoprenylcysteine O-methyltransferase Ste14
MVGFLLDNTGALYNFATTKDLSFTKYNIYNFYYRALFSLILFVDTIIFTFGYLVESKKLDNIVKSVEPTMLGWIVALICYPPFNSMSGDIFGWHTQDFNSFGDVNVTLFFGAVSLILFGIYVWATIALGWKSSNLTNRGIISKGPYKYVRHPAYISKNLSWWVMGIPFILVSPILSILSLSIWSFIYYLRAMTEERHLMADPDYVEYMKKTPYMFIPKVI